MDVHINRLRDRLKDNKDIQIVTVRGLGYKAVKTADKPQGASRKTKSGKATLYSPAWARSSAC